MAATGGQWARPRAFRTSQYELVNAAGVSCQKEQTSLTLACSYPPTPAHLTLLLNMLHVYEGTLHHPKTTLPEAPTLLVLHELSALIKPVSSEPTYVPPIPPHSPLRNTSTASPPTSRSSCTPLQPSSRSPPGRKSSRTLEPHLLASCFTERSPSRSPCSTAASTRSSCPYSGRSPPRRASRAGRGRRRAGGSPSRSSWRSTSSGLRGSKVRTLRIHMGCYAASERVFATRGVAIEDTDVAPESRAGGGRMRMVLHRSQDKDSAGDVAMEWVVATRIAGPHAGARYFTWA